MGSRPNHASRPGTGRIRKEQNLKSLPHTHLGVNKELKVPWGSYQKTDSERSVKIITTKSCPSWQRRKRRTKKRRSPRPDTMSRSTRPGRSPSVFSRLRQKESSSTRQRSLVSTTVFTRLGARDRNIFTGLGEKKRDIHSRLGPKVVSQHKHASNRLHVSSGRSAEDPIHRRKEAMPTWCHMFNSTLIGSARVWFDKLLPESIDSYEVLWKAFLGNFSQQKKYIKDPMEIHNIKQKEGESTKAFMEQFKAECMYVNGAPECKRISGFMHGITNPNLIKRLNDNIPKSVNEMMSVTTTFHQGEVTVANQSRKKRPPTWRHHETSHKPNFNKRPNFKNRHKPGRRQDRFTPLIKTPKKILAMETVKFKAPLPMKHIEEVVKFGQLSHLIKELKQGSNKEEHAKAAKKEETDML
ncbi:reverse transcriptase domain-containing protein [Tanacetum coccineum]